MSNRKLSAKSSADSRSFVVPARIHALWPHAPLAAVLALIGLLNILDGLRLPMTAFSRVEAIGGLAASLSALGGSAQIILGSMLVLSAIGLLWRSISAWTLSVSLMIVTVAVNVAQKNWGASLFLPAILLGFMFWAKRYFTRRTVFASVLFSISGILAVLAYGTIGAYLLRTGFKPPIQNGDWFTALYYTMVTLSTVGYGDIVPVSPEARWFALSLLVIGLGVFTTAIASALGPKISGEITRLLNPKDTTMDANNHVILVGEGATARNTAEELGRRGIAFIHIVASKGPTDAAANVIEGDATNDAVLRQANIQKARMVIAAREDDGENAFIVLGAKELNPGVRVLAVASSQRSIRRLKLARADVVFSPTAVGCRLLADLVQGNEILPEFQDLLERQPAEKSARTQN